MHYAAPFPGLDSTWLSASVEQMTDAGWRVEVSINRPPNDTPITSEDIVVVLEDAAMRTLVCTRQPGQWVEAGGAAGTTASAIYLFAPGAAIALVIRWLSHTARFQLQP